MLNLAPFIKLKKHRTLKSNGFINELNICLKSFDFEHKETCRFILCHMSNLLFFEYKIDSLTNYSINYTFNKDSLEEINVQINCKDVELTSYLFCDLKDYYANKLPNPTEDQGSIVYNCFEGQRKPFVVSLSDNSSPSRGVINMYIYKDK